MPDLAWDAFANLPGDPTRNWELLCRGIIERNYRRCGRLRSVRQQPGVEFHLELERDCSLGSPGDWFGWQCRWYDLPANKRLGQTRRQEIEHAIRTSEAHLPGLTDWVLWLRELPAKADVDWFNGLASRLRLHLWHEDDVQNGLVGEAAVMRSTYFGELVLTPESLANTHERTVEPIRKRWDPLVHVEVDVERTLRQALAEPTAWGQLQEQASKLEERRDEVLAGLTDIEQEADRAVARSLVDDLDATAARLREVAELCAAGRPGDATRASALSTETMVSMRELFVTGMHLRGERSPASLAVTPAVLDRRDGLLLLALARELLEAALFAVVGDAGQGKTFLSAQLTAPTAQRPAGILMLGADLARNHTLDDLARRVPGVRSRTIDELLEALDAAGSRAGRRLPLVIDGLNEAEDPRRWKALLAQLQPILHRYPHVLIVTTLRSSVADEALPDGVAKLTLEGFEHDLDVAFERYFEHYRINPGNALLQRARFRHPLFLRMFCEATNPDREREVGVEAIPATLHTVFQRYRDTATERIRQRLGLAPGYVDDALDKVAKALWDRQARSLPSADVAALVGDAPRDWDRSVMRALEEEGVLWRNAEPDWSRPRSAVLFDAFAGFLVADALVRSVPPHESAAFFSREDVWLALAGGSGQEHPLAGDILVGLVGALPESRRPHLYSVAPPEQRTRALAQTIDLEARHVDQETVRLLADLVRNSGPRPGFPGRDLFDRMMEVRDGAAHPLNAAFTDGVLRSFPTWARDLRWSEWCRARRADHEVCLHTAEARWMSNSNRTEADRLEALWFAWLLTTTARPLRDRATRALYWYGRGDAERLFDLTLQLIEVDDPYVWERLLAASYGVAMAHQRATDGEQFGEALGRYLEGLKRRFVGPHASHPTNHWLAREYISCTFEIAARLHPSAVPDTPKPDDLTFAPGSRPEVIGESDPRAAECRRAFGGDFENYRLGPLAEGRGNYQSEHPGFKQIVAEALGRIWDLGWRLDRFEKADGDIAHTEWRRDGNPGRTERYGKKYCWIAYYEIAGRLAAQAQLPEDVLDEGRPADVDIDPSFPESPPPLRGLVVPSWIQDEPVDQEAWTRTGVIELGEELLRPHEIDAHRGPWVLVHGWLEAAAPQSNRQVFGFFRGLLVSRTAVDPLTEVIRKREYLGNHFLPEKPAAHYTFLGEIPWARKFASDVKYVSLIPPWYGQLEDAPQPSWEVETLAHGYSYESYHSTLNLAGGNPVPSKALAQAEQLFGSPQSFDFVDAMGAPATLTRSAPTGFTKGHLLYVRNDVLRRYANRTGRVLMMVVWGERGTGHGWSEAPWWWSTVRQEYANLWREIRVVEL